MSDSSNAVIAARSLLQCAVMAACILALPCFPTLAALAADTPPPPAAEGVSRINGKAQEAKLIAVLTSNAEYTQKADACRELAHLGTADAVPALAAMLADDKLSHMARYALETIPGPAADAALRDALGKLKGLALSGVIASIGVRHDEKAVPALVALLKDPDTQVSQTAARTLGRIGTAEAANALGAALTGAPAARQPALCEGLFRCAESLAAKGQAPKAIAIYDTLRKLESAPHQVLTGAWRGAILSRGKDGLPLLLEAFRSSNPVLAACAERTAMEMKDAGVALALADELTKSPAARQILLCRILGERGDAAALPALLGLAAAGDQAARVAAILAVAGIGAAGAAEPLLGLLKDPDGEIAQAALATLASLPGAAVDAGIVKTLAAADPALQVRLLELVRQRRITTAAPQLVRLMAANNEAVKSSALKCYAELGGEARFAELLEQLVKATDAATLDTLEKALAAICGDHAKQQACVPQLVAALPKAGPEVKQVLLRTLCVAGGGEALEAVRAAVGDSNSDVHAAAIRVLSAWKSADVLPVLLGLAKTSATPADQILSLRGYLGMAARKDLPAAEKLAICQTSAPLIQRSEEKLLLLGTLGSLADAGALPLVVSYLDDPAVKREAVAAVLAVAGKRQPNQQVALTRSALEKARAAAADNPAVVERAQALLKQMENEK